MDPEHVSKPHRKESMRGSSVKNPKFSLQNGSFLSPYLDMAPRNTHFSLVNLQFLFRRGIFQHARVIAVYALTDTYPKNERYELTAHTRKTAISIPSNIAEGYRRGGSKEFRKFIRIAFGSGAELETQLEIARRLRIGDVQPHETAQMLLQNVMPMLNKMSATSR